MKTLSVDRFSKCLQVLLGQIEIYMLTRKYFPALQKTEILPENPVSETRNYTLI